MLSVPLFYACAGGAGGRARWRITAERATYSKPWMRRSDVFRAMDEEKEDQCELVTTPDLQTPGPSLATVRKRRHKERESVLWRRLQKLLEKPTEK